MENNSKNSMIAENLYEQYEKAKTLGSLADALLYLRRAASLGAVYAVYSLAYELYNSDPPSEDEALKLYRKAVRMGDPVSAWNISYHYKNKGNTKRYLFWLKKASEMGMEAATKELSRR